MEGKHTMDPVDSDEREIPAASHGEPALLSNGRYTTFVTAAGTGQSSFDGYALTRWTGDRTQDTDGFFLYVQDLEDGRVWSAGLQPAGRVTEPYDVRFQPGRVTMARREAGIETRLEVCVAPEDNIELRRLTMTNGGATTRRLAVTSYAEVVLHHPAADLAHPAFSKLFVQTERHASLPALLARRRPRGADEQAVWLTHVLASEGDEPVQFETDRMRFVGRGRSVSQPQALDPGVVLSGTAGNVLDPIVSLRRDVVLAPGGSVALTFGLGGAHDRETATMLANRYVAPAAVAHAFERAATRAEDELARLDVTPRRARYYERLGGALLYGDPRLRASQEILRRNRRTLDVMRPYDLGAQPMALVRVGDTDELKAARALLKAHVYWQHRGLIADLVIFNDSTSEEDDVYAALRKMMDAADRLRPEGAQGRVVILDGDEVPDEDQWLLQSAARIVVRGGVLPGFDEAPAPVGVEGVARPAARPDGATAEGADLWHDETLRFFNGYGGFNEAGDEYVIRLVPGADGRLRLPPLPWANVIANETFGFLTTETGAGGAWAVNSRENRITPWHNDPVTDPHGEALYLRDEEAGRYWSPLPGPVPAGVPYEVRHGFGYTRVRHHSHGLEQDVWQFVPRHDPVKVVRVRLTNRSDRTRRLSLFHYARWVLGVFPEESGRFVVTERDDATGAILATNPTNGEFANRVAFSAVVVPEGGDGISATGDRSTFIGRYGGPSAPSALHASSVLDAHFGAGLDPCAAFQVPVTLVPGGTLECTFLLGEAESRPAMRALVERYRAGGAVEDALEEVRAFWKDTLSGVRVETPLPAVDVMVNGWLPYQNLSCRLWGRTAYYQSGGAFGFRDQLQDAAALLFLMPELTRRQILLHAAHQFAEGDVLHWWHPPLSKGMRTRFSDDLLWLPYVTAYYVQMTGDASVLDEPARFLTARALKEGEDEVYLVPTESGEAADVYEHCCRALDRSLTKGPHGLPLMGTGDWNDGMNRVGREGRGESVWLGFFLYHILEAFIPLCERRGDAGRAGRYAAYRAHLAGALNDTGWDGAWYRRAYYDDGTPLGSAACDECRIDALAQAWAVISKAAPPERAAMAMDALEAHLVSEEEGLVRLLTPAFDRTANDPGYIKGYVAGVRENGGQYTHAALWVIRALAEYGRADRAAKLLDMLSPVSHARTPEQVETYRVEPYVVAADVYGEPPHVGRGGWTWYTGSAGWMYRVALESILGLRLDGGDTLVLEPRIPAGWPGFRLHYRRPGSRTTYDITVQNRGGTHISSVEVDGAGTPMTDGVARIPLAQDDAVHRVAITLG